MWSDPIADLLTRIRNAYSKEKQAVKCPASNIKVGICEVLKREGYISDFSVDNKEHPQGMIHINLKYGPEGELLINKIDRVSKPGRRIYKGFRDIPEVINGLGIMIVTTSKGVKSDRECRAEKLGGEILAYIW
ncbi:MAG: 30S ribosomal protein S8 [Planctomycetes bacterium]|nr:30S ribosomal protein S8 [Planctomycetota bacterium]